MPRKATDNPVFLAMIGIEELLDPLTDQGKAQVLRWALDEYGHVLRGGRPERLTPDVTGDRPAAADRDHVTYDESLDGRPVGVEP
jgi:hypothetical protein